MQTSTVVVLSIFIGIAGWVLGLLSCYFGKKHNVSLCQQDGMTLGLMRVERIKDNTNAL